MDNWMMPENNVYA